MSRSQIEVKTNKTPDTINKTITDIVGMYGFEHKIVSGERVWAKGDGVMMDMQCFAVTFKKESVIVEAWFKSALLGESDLTGIIGAIPKKKAKEIMIKIVSAIEEK